MACADWTILEHSCNFEYKQSIVLVLYCLLYLWQVPFCCIILLLPFLIFTWLLLIAKCVGDCLLGVYHIWWQEWDPFFIAAAWRDPLGSGKWCQPEMSVLKKILKAWKEEHAEEMRQQQERFQRLIQGLERRPPCCIYRVTEAESDRGWQHWGFSNNLRESSRGSRNGQR